MKTIVVGLGNPILGDDGVGWKVADVVERRLPSPSKGESEIVVDRCSLGGLRLMEQLIGYDRAIIIDAITTGGTVGSVIASPLHKLPDRIGHTSSAHDTSLHHALELGKQMGAQLPKDITIVGIVIAPAYDFSERLSPEIADAVSVAADAVMQLLQPVYAKGG
jgi:hydrogenase maturation protease